MHDHPHHPIPTVGGFVIAPDGEILLVKSYKWKGGYSVPGGKIEYGETREEAFIREIREETGLEVNQIEYLMTIDCIDSSQFWKSGYHFVMHEYIGSLATGFDKEDVALNDEHEEYLWINPLKAKNLKLNRETYVLLEWYLSHFSKKPNKRA